MRLVIDKFKIVTNKTLQKPVKLVLVSDIHVGENPLSKGTFNMDSTLRGLKKIEDIDMFVLCGDFVNSADGLTSSRVRRNLAEFIEALAKIAKVVMVRGNHDLFDNDVETEQIYQDFAGIDNVILLDNAQKKIDGITLTGFAPRHESYDLIKHGKRSHKITIADFKAGDFKFDKNNFNVILTHSPYSLTNKRAMRELPEVYKKCDLVLSGHLHNGLAMSGNSRLFKRVFDQTKFIDVGFWCDPKTGFMSKHCRGAKFVGENKIGKTILPSSKDYVEIDLTDNNTGKVVQVTGKGINKFSVVPVIAGRPSVVEVIIKNE